MAKKQTIDLIIKTFKELGGNVSDVLGSRTNVSFLGVGDNVEPFLDRNLNEQALGVLSQSKAIDEAKGAVGFAVSDKLNDIQANNLLINLNKMKDFYMPPANITDLATGARNLDAEGLGALRAKGDYMTDEGVMASETILPMRKTDEELAAMAEKIGLNDPNKNRFLRNVDEVDLPPPGSRGGPDDIAAPFASAEETISNLREMPTKRASAREFLVEALKEDDVAKGGNTFSDFVTKEDVKYITEGGGCVAGDPLVLVEKYFGPRIAEMVPTNASSEEIAIFTKRVLNNVVDAAGNRPDSPRFDRFTARFIDEVQDFAKGGLAKILEV